MNHIVFGAVVISQITHGHYKTISSEYADVACYNCIHIYRSSQVNDVPLCPMTHEQAVIFLRQASVAVKLRLYRDTAQTPIASMSPTNSESRALCNNNKQKASLR